MEEGTVGHRLALAAILEGTNDFLPEHESKLLTIQDLAKMDKYRNLHEQFFSIATALLLHDFSAQKFLDLSVRQQDNVGFITSLDLQRQMDDDGAYSEISYASLGGHDYAIKYFEGIDDEEDIYREIAIQNAVYLMIPQHVPLIRSWTLEYIVMNKVSGATVQDFCANEANKLSKAQLVSVLDIFTRFAFLGITHGDIHGGNIIIRDSDGSVFVIDFGISAFQEKYKIDDDTDLLEVFKKFAKNGELTADEVASLGFIGLDAKTRDTASAKDLLPVLNRMRLVLDHKMLVTRMDIGADGRVVKTPVVAHDRYYPTDTVTPTGISREYLSLFSSAQEIVFLDSSRK